MLLGKRSREESAESGAERIKKYVGLPPGKGTSVVGASVQARMALVFRQTVVLLLLLMSSSAVANPTVVEVVLGVPPLSHATWMFCTISNAL